MELELVVRVQKMKEVLDRLLGDPDLVLIFLSFKQSLGYPNLSLPLALGVWFTPLYWPNLSGYFIIALF